MCYVKNKRLCKIRLLKRLNKYIQFNVQSTNPTKQITVDNKKQAYFNINDSCNIQRTPTNKSSRKKRLYPQHSPTSKSEARKKDEREKRISARLLGICV